MRTLAFAESKRPMSRDGRKPRREPRGFIDRRKRFKREQQRVLGDVFGVFASNDGLSRAHDRRAITCRKLIKSTEIAEYRGNDQNFIRRLPANFAILSLQLDALIIIETREVKRLAG